MKKVTLINANILDGTKNMILKEGTNIEIIDEKISRIGTFSPDKNSKIVDLENKYVCPGLINLHSHLPSAGKVGKIKVADKSKLAKFAAENPIGRIYGLHLGKVAAMASLKSGVTTVRAVGGVGNLDSILRDKINNNKIFGPRLIVCNTAIGVKGGHMDEVVALPVSSKEEALERIIKLKNEGVDLVKLMITGGVLDGKEPGHPAPLMMSKELVDTCVKKSHELGLKVCAHVESPEGMKVAIETGVDTIEHGSDFDKSLIKLMIKQNQAVVTTLSPALPFTMIEPKSIGYQEVAQINSKIVLDGIIKASKICIESGIKVGLGTDSGSTLTAHYNFYKEMIAFKKYVKDDSRLALHLATLANAEIAGIDNVTGSVEVNKYADLVVVNENPLTNLETFRNPSYVFMKGKMIKNPKPKRYKQIDQLLVGIF